MINLTKENNKWILSFMGLKIQVTRFDLIKLRNYINNHVNEMDES